MYYRVDGSINWSSLREWYAAFLRAVELGKAQWGDDPLVFGEPILRKARFGVKVSNKSQISQGNKTLFCLDYQYNRCSLAAPSSSWNN